MTQETYRRLVPSQSQITATRLDQRSHPRWLPTEVRAFVNGTLRTYSNHAARNAHKTKYLLPEGVQS